MNKITREEKVKIFDDLIKYYRFCKSDRRNHIFNAIYAAKKYRKSGASKQELDEVEKSFQKAKNSYSYYSRMKVVALLLKLNLNDFITQEEKKQAIEDLLFHYDWRIKTCLFHIQASEKSLEKYREEKDINDVKFKELEIRLLDDKEQYNNYVEKQDLAKRLKDEIFI